MLQVMGIDPGLSSQGVVVLRQKTKTAPPEIAHAAVTKTEKLAGKKRKRDLRVSADDQRRFGELLGGLNAAVKTLGRSRLNAVCIEVYAARMGSGKAALAYGGASFWAQDHGYIVLPAVPQDVKRGICGKVSASKQDVEDRLRELIPGLQAELDKLPKTQREHLADAAAHALIGLQEMWDLRQLTGGA